MAERFLLGSHSKEKPPSDITSNLGSIVGSRQGAKFETALQSTVCSLTKTCGRRDSDLDIYLA